MEKDYKYYFDHVKVIANLEELAGYKIDKVTYDSYDYEGDGEDGTVLHVAVFLSGDTTILYNMNNMYEGASISIGWQTAVKYQKNEKGEYYLDFKPEEIKPGGYLSHPFQVEQIEALCKYGIAKWGLYEIAKDLHAKNQKLIDQYQHQAALRQLDEAKQKVKELEEKVKAQK